jgi:hypothetical protein
MTRTAWWLALGLGACAPGRRGDAVGTAPPPVEPARAPSAEAPAPSRMAQPAPESATAQPAASAGAAEETLRLEGVVRLSPDTRAPPQKSFAGALFEAADGTVYVISYDADSPYHELRDQRVQVEAVRYTPIAQALLMPHLRVVAMKLAKPAPGPSLVEVGAERRIAGRFEERVFPEGSKLAGEKWLELVADDGARFSIQRLPAARPALGQPVTVTAHPVEPSPFVARPGGAYLWVLRIAPR